MSFCATRFGTCSTSPREAIIVVVAYYNAEEAFYGQSDAVSFRLHIFYMEGERWTRLIEVRLALPSRDLELRLFVRVFGSPDAVSPSDLSLRPYKLRSLVGLLYDILLYVQLRTALIA